MSPHAFTSNGAIHQEMKDPSQSPEEMIARRLANLDGEKYFALCLWALPPGREFWRVDLTEWPQEYIQAGGTSTCLTVEVRVRGAQGLEQYVVGDSAAATDSTRVVSVERGAGRSELLPHEVFDAQRACSAFLEYLRDGALSEKWTLRKINFG